jgi:probable F420-dependent oxidoreductase
MQLGRVGLWTFQLDLQPAPKAREAAQEIESLGYRTVWVPEAVGRDPMVNSALLLSATTSLNLATGIASIWSRDAMACAASHLSLSEAFPDRFLLGLGVSHQPMVDFVKGHHYDKPLTKMSGYLDAMDAAVYVAPRPERARRVLAALGPKMLQLAATKADGAHPYFVPVEHTAFARQRLGSGPVLAVEQTVVLEPDASEARAIARGFASGYLGSPNYANNLKRMGWTDADVSGRGSDAVIDAVVAWGDVDTIAVRVRQHLDAGADHVCVQVVTGDDGELALDGLRELLPALREL